jgi:chaperonin GroES
MNFKPLYDQVLVKRDTAKTQTMSGLIIPDTASAKPHEGVVVAVGSGKRDKRGNITPIKVKVGDHIMIGKNGTDVTIDGNEYVIIPESGIAAVILKP